MSRPLLIIFIGPSCAGKTSIGQKVASEFNAPFLSKDSIKEIFFDHMGWTDRQYSLRVGNISYPVLYYFAELFMKNSSSMVVMDANFVPYYDTKKIKFLIRKYNVFPIQISLKADGAVLCRRFQKRAFYKKRHPGHCESDMFEEIKPALLKGEKDVLKLGGEIIEIDTTNFKKVNYQNLYEEIRKYL